MILPVTDNKINGIRSVLFLQLFVFKARYCNLLNVKT